MVFFYKYSFFNKSIKPTAAWPHGRIKNTLGLAPCDV